MKTIKVPEGWEIDFDNSTNDTIALKEMPVAKKLPSTWEELETVSGWFVSDACNVESTFGRVLANDDNSNVLPKQEYCTAIIALSKLITLRDVYRQGWVPDYTTGPGNSKHCICFIKNEVTKDVVLSIGEILSFQSAEIRNLFLENFRDLIDEIHNLYK